MFKHIESLFQIITCTLPPLPIGKPNKSKIYKFFGFQCYCFITSCRFIQFRTITIIRKSKCSRISKRKVHFTKRNV